MKKIIISSIVVIVIILIALFGFNKGSNDKDLKIGVVLPLTGPASYVGEDYKKGMELAASDFGVNINFADGKAAPTDSLNAALNLYNSGSNVILTAFRGASLSVASNFKDKKDVLVFSTTATSDTKPIGNYGKNFFAIGAEMNSNGFILGENAAGSCKNVSVLTEQTDGGKDKVKGFVSGYKKDPVLSEEFAVDKSDFKDLVTKIKSSNADCVFIEVKSNYFKLFLDQMANQNVNSKIYSTSYSVNKDVIKTLSDKQKTNIIVSSTATYSSDEFNKRFYEKYNRQPNDFSLIGYEMVKMLALGKKNCDSGDVESCVSKQLKNTNNYDSFVGKLNIDKDQEIKLRDNVLFKIVGDSFEVVE